MPTTNHVTQEKLNTLLGVEFEKWPKRGVKLRAVSANASGHVNSGILHDGRYFYRAWRNNFSESTFVIEGRN